MRRHIDHERNAQELGEAMQMIAKASRALLTRPLSDSDVIWAKGCLERGAESLEVVIEDSREIHIA